MGMYSFSHVKFCRFPLTSSFFDGPSDVSSDVIAAGDQMKSTLILRQITAGKLKRKNVPIIYFTILLFLYKLKVSHCWSWTCFYFKTKQTQAHDKVWSLVCSKLCSVGRVGKEDVREGHQTSSDQI